MRHEFHFVVNEKLYIDLSDLSRTLNKSLSATIIYIFENMNPFLEKNHLKAKEKGSKYEIIAGLEEKRHQIHCYLPEYLFRKMKLIHQDLNTYSLDQIIKKMITYFLIGRVKYGFEVFMVKLKKINYIWDNKKNIYQKEKKKNIRLLLYNFASFLYCSTTYTNNFCPVIIQF